MEMNCNLKQSSSFSTSSRCGEDPARQEVCHTVSKYSGDFNCFKMAKRLTIASLGSKRFRRAFPRKAFWGERFWGERKKCARPNFRAGKKRKRPTETLATQATLLADCIVS